jgi:hypothetical protein
VVTVVGLALLTGPKASMDTAALNAPATRPLQS